MDYQDQYTSIINNFTNGNFTDMVEGIIEMDAIRFIDWLNDGHISSCKKNKILAIYIKRTNHVIQKWSK